MPRADLNSVGKTIEMLRTDPNFRIGLTTRSHLWFFMTYFRDHIAYALADFHKELFRLTESSHTLVTAVAFRSSGKSTILSLSFPLWSALSGRKKFILIVSKTESQVKQIMYNIKAELEGNPYLASDFGPFNAGDVWNELSLVIAGNRARIVGVSVEHSLRGLKHLSSRPDLIILDDVEDMDSVRTGDSRDKRYRWFKSEVIPAGGETCQVWVIGNLLHEDSLVSRLREEIEKKEIDGVYRQYPILANGKPTWPSRFQNPSDVDALRMKIGDERAFKREYLLEITPEVDQVVDSRWLRYYDILPDTPPNKLTDGWEIDFVCSGIDLAISQREAADYTAIVSAVVYTKVVRDRHGNYYHDDYKIYILPVVTNAHLTLNGIIDRTRATEEMFKRKDEPYHCYVEDVGLQRAIIEAMENAHMRITGVKTDGMDKRSRLMIAARQLEIGKIYFPRTGAEDVIRQIVGLGSERHDDLADAFSTLVRQAVFDATHHATFGIWRLT